MDIFSAPLIPAIIAAVIMFVIYMAIDTWLGGESKTRNLREYEDAGYTSEDPVGITPQKTDTALGMDGLMGSLGVSVESGTEEWRQKCDHAGIFSPNAPTYFLLYKRLLGPILAVIGILVILGSLKFEGMDMLLRLIAGLILAIIGIMGADLWVQNSTVKRQELLTRSFPDTLDLLVVCVESGLALDASLARVCKELGKAYPEITRELNKTRVELALLNDRPRALMNLAERTNLVSFRSLVAALIQTEKFGTSLTDTLRVLSEDYRLTRLMIAEQKAGRLPVIMTVPLILLLMPAFIMIILGPPFIQVRAQGGLFGSAGAE